MSKLMAEESVLRFCSQCGQGLEKDTDPYGRRNTLTGELLTVYVCPDFHHLRRAGVHDAWLEIQPYNASQGYRMFEDVLR